MPEKEAELTALENEKTAGAESRSAETAETLAAEAAGAKRPRQAERSLNNCRRSTTN